MKALCLPTLFFILIAFTTPCQSEESSLSSGNLSVLLQNITDLHFLDLPTNSLVPEEEIVLNHGIFGSDKEQELRKAIYKKIDKLSQKYNLDNKSHLARLLTHLLRSEASFTTSSYQNRFSGLRDLNYKTLSKLDKDLTLLLRTEVSKEAIVLTRNKRTRTIQPEWQDQRKRIEALWDELSTIYSLTRLVGDHLKGFKHKIFKFKKNGIRNPDQSEEAKKIINFLESVKSNPHQYENYLNTLGRDRQNQDELKRLKEEIIKLDMWIQDEGYSVKSVLQHFGYRNPNMSSRLKATDAQRLGRRAITVESLPAHKKLLQDFREAKKIIEQGKGDQHFMRWQRNSSKKFRSPSSSSTAATKMTKSTVAADILKDPKKLTALVHWLRKNYSRHMQIYKNDEILEGHVVKALNKISTNSQTIFPTIFERFVRRYLEGLINQRTNTLLDFSPDMIEMQKDENDSSNLKNKVHQIIEAFMKRESPDYLSFFNILPESMKLSITIENTFEGPANRFHAITTYRPHMDEFRIKLNLSQLKKWPSEKQDEKIVYYLQHELFHICLHFIANAQEEHYAPATNALQALLKNVFSLYFTGVVLFDQNGTPNYFSTSDYLSLNPTASKLLVEGHGGRWVFAMPPEQYGMLTIEDFEEKELRLDGITIQKVMASASNYLREDLSEIPIFAMHELLLNKNRSEFPQDILRASEGILQNRFTEHGIDDWGPILQQADKFIQIVERSIDRKRFLINKAQQTLKAA